MKKILVVSHGTMAEGIIDSSKVILGDLIDAQSCCLKMGQGIEDFEMNLKEIIEEYGVDDEIIVLADLKGGSPYRTAISVLSEKGLLENSTVITGVNLPMLINVSMKDTSSKNDIFEVITESKDSIEKFEINIDEDDEI